MPDQSDVEFIEFVEQTLIPDLHQIGFHETADDLERLVDIIRNEERWLELKHQGFVKL